MFDVLNNQFLGDIGGFAKYVPRRDGDLPWMMNPITPEQEATNAKTQDRFVAKYGDGTSIQRREIGGGRYEMNLVDPSGNVLETRSYEHDTPGGFEKAAMALAAAAAAYVGGTALGGGFGGAPAAGNGAFLGEGVASGIPAWDAAAGIGNFAGATIPQFAQQPGYGNVVATLADSSGASPFTGAGGASAADPIGAYLTTGGAEGSIIGNGITGAGGAAGAVGAGTAANFLGGASNALSSLGKFAGGNSGLINLGGNLLNSYLGYNASQNAADAQLQSGRESNALQKYMFDQIRSDNLPALDARNFGLSGYRNLLANPNSITSDPGYKFGLDQGVAAYDNSGAARGMRLSGGQAKALTRFGQDYAGTKLDQSLNRYGNLSGLGQVGAGTIANAGQNYATNVGNTTTGMGNAAASGYIGGANAITGGVNNFLRNWNEQQLLDKYLKP